MECDVMSVDKWKDEKMKNLKKSVPSSSLANLSHMFTECEDEDEKQRKIYGKALQTAAIIHQNLHRGIEKKKYESLSQRSKKRKCQMF